MMMRTILFSALMLCLALLGGAATAGAGGAQTVNPASVVDATTKCEVQAFVVDPDPAGLNVRRAPDKDAAVITKLKHGDYTIAVAITGATGQWARIRDAEAEETGDALFKGPGWVYAPLLATQARGKYGTNLDKPVVKVLREPDKHSAVVTTLPVETQVNVIGCRGDWVQVRYKKFEGWLPPESQCANTLTTCG
ncbi:MAG: SH3 domain-containing protein [Pyrinomonadaceae bacterium]